MKNILSVIIFTILSGIAMGQELNCEVSVQAPQVSNLDQAVVDRLQGVILEFMNNRRWTNDEFKIDERIECNLLITITNATNQTSFEANLQIQSSRPVFNSDYKTPVFSVNDGDFSFQYSQNDQVIFNPGQFDSNLSSVLAYYAYMIIGMDYDTFAMEGGTDYFLKAQTIVANAQNFSFSGWKASEKQTNRFWLVENLLSQTFAPLRKALYDYHRLGYDMLYSELEVARATIKDCLVELKRVHQVKPSSYNLQLFFFAKSDEIIQLFKPAPAEEKIQLYQTLKLIDPGNIQKYTQLEG